jgi:hypothetical protein
MILTAGRVGSARARPGEGSGITADLEFFGTATGSPAAVAATRASIADRCAAGFFPDTDRTGRAAGVVAALRLGFATGRSAFREVARADAGVAFRLLDTRTLHWF